MDSNWTAAWQKPTKLPVRSEKTGAKKINVLFPETSQYILGSVGRDIFWGGGNFYIGKSMKIIQNILKIEEKFSEVPKKFGVSPKKYGH